MSKRLEYNATLVERSDLTPDLALFAVCPDAPPEEPWFRPGQYAVVGLNPTGDAGDGPVERPMTMTSAAQERDRLEFLIRRIARPDSENPLTHTLWSMPLGSRLHLRARPAGTFTFERAVDCDDARLILCVAGDTGLAPFVSMVRTLERAGRAGVLGRVAILHGASSPADLAYRAELSAMASECGLHYLPCVSHPGDSAGWAGDTGAVEEFFAPDRMRALEDRLGSSPGGLTPDTAVVFACGLRQAIAGSILHLLARGFVPNHRRLRKAIEAPADVDASFFFEHYDAGPVLNAKDPAVASDLRARFRRASEGTDANS